MNTGFLTATLAIMFLLCGGVSAAQDRVLLHERFTRQIREIEITDGGRRWSTVRTFQLPPQLVGVTLAPVADGTRLVCMVRDSASRSSVLVQYDLASERASIVDTGRFELDAYVLADKARVRVFVIEPSLATVTFIDAALRRETIAVPGLKRIAAAYVADRSLLLHRYTSANDGELVVIDTDRREIVRALPLERGSRLLVPRTGARIYRTSYAFDLGQRLEAIDLTSGSVLARSSPLYDENVLQFDDSRNVVIYQKTVPRESIVALDAATLAVVGEFVPGFSERRVDWKVSFTSRERAILLFNRNPIGGYFGDRSCEGASPRIDIFDGSTFALVNRIELQRSCPAIIPLPR